MNRETWLENAAEALRPLLLERADVEVPMISVAVGWPSKGGTSAKKRRIGECWRPDAVENGVGAIFISPSIGDPVQVLDVLLHEMIHAATPGAGHRGEFIRIAKDVGLVKPWTSTSPDAELLLPVLKEIAEGLGDYPHSKITPSVQRPTQTTRMLKVQCPVCEYTVRTTQKWIDVGLPTCPDGDEMELAA